MAQLHKITYILENKKLENFKTLVVDFIFASAGFLLAICRGSGSSLYDFAIYSQDK